jgi:hypothetical protein
MQPLTGYPCPTRQRGRGRQWRAPMNDRPVRRRSRINLKSAWISAPALLHAGQARLILGAQAGRAHIFQQASKPGPCAAWSRSLTRPPLPSPTGTKCYSKFLVGIYIAEPPPPPNRQDARPESPMPTLPMVHWLSPSHAASTWSQCQCGLSRLALFTRSAALLLVAAYALMMVAYGPHRTTKRTDVGAGGRYLFLGTGRCHMLRRVPSLYRAAYLLTSGALLTTTHVPRHMCVVLCSSVPSSSSCPR